MLPPTVKEGGASSSSGAKLGLIDEQLTQGGQLPHASAVAGEVRRKKSKIPKSKVRVGGRRIDPLFCARLFEANSFIIMACFQAKFGVAMCGISLTERCPTITKRSGAAGACFDAS